MLRVARSLLQLEDSPRRTALSFAVGVWIAFFPVWGIHTLMALGLAFLFRLNRSAILLGAWINNPWTVAPLYTLGTFVGCLLLGAPPEGVHWIDWAGHGSALRIVAAELRPYLWPFVVGNTVVGVVSGLLSYVAVRTTLERRAVEGPEAA
jgi:uncharacterized protein (DUF2062 family)